MRSEEEMIGLILEFASNNDDVRAVIMNGSRVNPNVPKDLFRDYDIVYFVRDVEPYKRNREIVRYFGDIMILQTPDDMGDPPPQDEGGYAYLMQFLDGNRIDLSFFSTEDIQRCVEDTLSVVLLDKDNLIGELPPPSDLGYLPKKPTAKAFDDCCNEFWWLAPYVAKGLWRGELTYAKYMLDTLMREQLMRMLTWYVGMTTDFRRSPGKLGKYLKGQIDDELWALLERTYSDALVEHTWEALFAMGELFRRVAQPVASAFGFTYPEQDDQNVSDYVRLIRAIPSDAKALDTIHKIEVYLEIGQKRTVAGAIDWPGWCRIGPDENSALQALFDHGVRYARVLDGTPLGFQTPTDPSIFTIVERLKGTSTTDFGAPDAAPTADARPIDAEELERLLTLLHACWQAFDLAVQAVAGKALAKGPRGGGRELEDLVRHVLNADANYLGRLAWKFTVDETGELAEELDRCRRAIQDALAAAGRGELPTHGPRGGVLWTPRYFVRRVAWHVLDHAWEIEDRIR